MIFYKELYDFPRESFGKYYDFLYDLEEDSLVKRINFYQKKYEALETFYGWVDQGSEYDIAAEQSVYYNHGLEEIDEIILNITIATRYSRCGKTISEQFKERLEALLL